ncbi:phosphate signaling complex protein PhoU [Iamia majanohamensis]|uniref:Phosphate-specific transport system accessory protein PhoU n=1 Tax=Iamia majanohamensis TaxID=467976 RepID=A0AAE9Y6E5_9ACTN|nr:phosphate signaling complex protein PhoU [Iamia majanohamensis]WCO67534.1 phosphate signaling complex protein PhoU [Iamia majanohamensis]
MTDIPGDQMETRRTYHQQLEDIQADIVRMAALVTEGVPRTTQVLLDHDLGGAQEIIDGDDPLDALAVETEERCYTVFALQQPLASDLRGLITAVRMVAEIERSGDLVVNIAKGTRRIYGTEYTPRLRGLISRMGEEAARLFRLAIDSYAEGDAAMAAALDDLDDRLDDLHQDYIAEIFEASAAGVIEVQAAVQLALIGRYYERIGDHAVNIGERVRYMVTGWLPEQTGAAREAARQRAADESEPPPLRSDEGV